jgi:hypothetical protein
VIVIDKDNFDPKLIIPKLKEKTNLFDYETDESYIRRMKQGAFIIFLTEHIIVPCEYLSYPSGLTVLELNVVKISTCENTLDHIISVLKEIEDYATKMGIDRIIIEGRLGWSRVFKDYETERITLFKNLRRTTDGLEE